MKSNCVRLGLCVLAGLGLAALSAQAVPVRIASFNVAFGIDTNDDGVRGAAIAGLREQLALAETLIAHQTAE